MRKQVAELACQTVDEPGQARLVEKLFGIATGLQELEEEIRKVREERGGPERKRKLMRLIAIRDGLEPCIEHITQKEGPLRLHRKLLERRYRKCHYAPMRIMAHHSVLRDGMIALVLMLGQRPA